MSSKQSDPDRRKKIHSFKVMEYISEQLLINIKIFKHEIWRQKADGGQAPHQPNSDFFCLWRLHGLTPSFWGSLQLQAVEKHQGSTKIHRNTWIPLPAANQSSTRMSSMKAWAGPTPLPLKKMHLSWDNTREMDPSADKPPFWFLQLRKLYSSFKGSISDFLHCLKLHFFRSVAAQNPSCHTTRGL